MLLTCTPDEAGPSLTAGQEVCSSPRVSQDQSTISELIICLIVSVLLWFCREPSVKRIRGCDGLRNKVLMEEAFVLAAHFLLTVTLLLCVCVWFDGKPLGFGDQSEC